MKKLTKSVLAVVLTASFTVSYAQKSKVDTAGTKDIEGVVVTALGIKREKKSLGYASQEVKSSALTEGTTKTGNVTSLLSGKVAGLQVNSNSNFGGTSNVVIRGYKSLSGGTPLVVIDGSPISNNNGNNNGVFDYGNGLSDINQEDVESINVLKGAAASALYGERGLNGVIIITTKKGKGKDDNTWGITLSSDFNVGFVDKSTFPTYQKRYGAGYGPYYSSADGLMNEAPDGNLEVPFGEDASYGKEFDPNLLVYQWNAYSPYSSNYGKLTPWVAAKNGPLSFFETPITYTNTVSLEKGNKISNFLLTYTNQISNGLMPNSDLRKNTLSAKFGYKLNEKLTANVYSTLTLQNVKGRNETGYSDNILSGFRQWWQTNVDLQEQRDVYFKSGGLNDTWNRNSSEDGSPLYWNNPYFQRYQNYQSDDKTRNFSYASLDYKVSNNLGFTLKLSHDFFNQTNQERLAVGSLAQSFGRSGNNAPSGYAREKIYRAETNFDFIGNYKYDFTDDFNVSGIFGANVRRNAGTNQYGSTEEGLAIPGIYALTNSAGLVLPDYEYEFRTASASAYAQASFAFKNTYYLDATYRVDKSSTLPKGSNVYGYPSITGAVILSNLIKEDWLSFAKVRANYAEVGSSTGPYQLENTYTARGLFNGVGLISLPSVLKYNDLKPEIAKETEVGVEADFFNGRLGFDVALYKTKTFNQIINLPISSSSGYSYKVFNAGRIDNKGIEVQLKGSPIRSNDFRWDVTVNWSKNENEVVEILEGANVLQLATYQGGVSLNAEVGSAYGVLYGTDYVYTNGQKTIDPNTGRYLRTAESNKNIGNITPDWIGGVRNQFSYKNLSFGFLIDMQKGGDVFSTDMYYGLATGLYAETAIGDYRIAGVVHTGVNPNGQTNTKATISPNYYGNVDGYRRMPNARFVYDASYVKLREANISYSLPKSLLQNTFVNEAKISIVGRNLWIIHKNLPYADPEVRQGGGIAYKGNSIGTLPTTRDIGVNLTLKF